MWEHLQKHIEILKTIPSIKRNIEELKFGCYIEYKTWYIGRVTEDVDEMQRIRNNIDVGLAYTIGAIHSWHLLKFMDKKWKEWHINEKWRISEHYFDKMRSYWRFTDLKLDNTKPYMEQSEDFFKKLNNYLIENFTF